MTTAQDIDDDFKHLHSMILHSWSEREVAAFTELLREKVRNHLSTVSLRPEAAGQVEKVRVPA